MQISIFSLVSLMSVSAFAQNIKLPNPTNNQEICFARAYSDEHLKANKAQKIRGAFVTIKKYDDDSMLYSTVGIMDLGGRTFMNYGSIHGAFPAKIAQVGIDSDGGRYTITQNQKNMNKVTVDVSDYIYLEEAVELAEGAVADSFSIKAGSADSKMALDLQVRAAGNAKTCEEIMQDMADAI